MKGEQGREDGRAHPEIRAQIDGHRDPLPFWSLSVSEQSQVIVSGALAIADRDSRHGPVVLIVELGGQLLPDDLLFGYARQLADPVLKFQTILVSPTERPRVDWSGWSIARLEGSPPRVLVRQEVIAV